MNATLSIVNSRTEEFAIDQQSVDFQEEEHEGKVILTNNDLGIKFSIKSLEGVASINIVIGETNKNVIVNYNDEKANASRCCVTCNGYTFCGDTACCEISPGTNQWLCC